MDLLATHCLSRPPDSRSLAYLTGGTWLTGFLLQTLHFLVYIQDGSVALRTRLWAVHCAKTHSRRMPQWLVYISIIISWIYFQPMHTLSRTNWFLTFSLFLLLLSNLPFQLDVLFKALISLLLTWNFLGKCLASSWDQPHQWWYLCAALTRK